MKFHLPYDMGLLLLVMPILCLGLIMIFSASSELAKLDYKDSYYFFRRQLIASLIGLVLLIMAKKIPYQLYKKLAYPILGGSIVLLGLVYVPGFGRTVGGATRWLNMGLFSFQPSEAAKLALAIYLAYSLDRKAEQMRFFCKGFLPHMVTCGVFVGLILPQPDLGMSVIICGITISMLFAGGARILHLTYTACACFPFLIYAIFLKSYRMERLLAFLDPWQDPLGRGFQIIHSFYAFGSGGILGAGFGAGKQKLFYLPEPHTDFIFSVLGEELGFVGVCMALALYFCLLWKAFQISSEAPDRFGFYLGQGITFCMGFPMLVHFGVVLGLLPTKGMALPFMSYGGSSLILNMMAIGILLNIRAQAHRRPKK